MSEKQDHDSEYKELSGTEGPREDCGAGEGDSHLHDDECGDGRDNVVAADAVQNTPFDGTLWFLTRNTSEKIGEVTRDEHVMLTFAEPKDSKYIALKGLASVSADRGKIKELWNPMYKAWFPKGEDDPEIAVLQG